VLHRGSNCPLSRAMDGRIMRRGIISSCQSAATSEIVKRCCSSLCKQRYSKYSDLYLFFTGTQVLWSLCARKKFQKFRPVFWATALSYMHVHGSLRLRFLLQNIYKLFINESRCKTDKKTLIILSKVIQIMHHLNKNRQNVHYTALGLLRVWLTKVTAWKRLHSLHMHNKLNTNIYLLEKTTTFF